MSDEALLHDLWTKAVGTPGYDKRRWQQLESLLRHLTAAREQLAAQEAEIVRLTEEQGRRKGDAVTRLHNLCEALEQESKTSPFSQEAWDELDAENKALVARAEAAEARVREVEAERDLERHEKNVLLSGVHSGPTGARGTYLALLANEVARAMRPLKEESAALRAVDAGHLSRIDGLKTRVEILTAELVAFRALEANHEARVREVEAERDALQRALETPPGCEHAGRVYAHCLACELDAEKTRYLLMSVIATRAANEVDRLRDALTRIGHEIVAVAPDSGKCDSVGEIYHLLRDVGALDALARKHAAPESSAADNPESFAPNGMGKEDEG